MSILDSSGELVLLAYGAAPGMELIPYFFALLAWLGMALAGILFWPVTALIRRLRGRRPEAITSSPSPKGSGVTEAPAAGEPASNGSNVSG